MNRCIENMNVFFDACYSDVVSNKLYIQRKYNITNEQISKLRTVQPKINIYELSKLIMETAGVRRATKTYANGRERHYNAFDRDFDSPLSSLWFSYERFLFMKTLGTHGEYADFAIDVITETFLRFFQNVNLEILNSPQMVTAFLNRVLMSNLINELKKQDTRQLQYDDLLSYAGTPNEPIDTSGDVDFDDAYYSHTELTQQMRDFFSYDSSIVNKIDKIISGESAEFTDDEKERLIGYLNGDIQYTIENFAKLFTGDTKE